MKTKPFNLERALKGEPVVLRNGDKAYIRHLETELKMTYPLMGLVVEEGSVDDMQWTQDGHYHKNSREGMFDIMGMWSKPIVFNHWDLLHEDIKYLAKEKNGDWYGYFVKPDMFSTSWGAVGWRSAMILNPTLFPDCDWGNSLIERPNFTPKP